MDLLAVLRQQRLVGGDDRLAAFHRGQDQRAGRLDAADHLDHDVHVGPGRQPHRVGRQQRGVDAGTRVRQPPHRDAGELEPRAGPHREFGRLRAQQPGDLGADDAAAEQRHPEHLAIWLSHPTSNRSRSSSVSRRTISRAAPSRTATTPGRGRWL